MAACITADDQVKKKDKRDYVQLVEHETYHQSQNTKGSFLLYRCFDCTRGIIYLCHIQGRALNMARQLRYMLSRAISILNFTYDREGRNAVIYLDHVQTWLGVFGSKKVTSTLFFLFRPIHVFFRAYTLLLCPIWGSTTVNI